MSVQGGRGADDKCSSQSVHAGQNCVHHLGIYGVASLPLINSPQFDERVFETRLSGGVAAAWAFGHALTFKLLDISLMMVGNGTLRAV